MGGYKKWFTITISIILLMLIPVAAFNYYIDPLWTFNHKHNFNSIQMPFNERQQKTNYITYHDFDYNTLLLGSSRTTYISQYDFTGLKTYNYSVSNMVIDEYDDYINYAKKVKGSDFEYIIIGLDFMGTNANLERRFEEPSYYIDKAAEPGYRFKMLLSKDTLEYACKNYRAAENGQPVNFAYDRNNIKTLLPVTEQERTVKIHNTILTYRNEIYAKYEYEDIKATFTKLKAENPDTRFIIFTTPVSLPLMQLVDDEGLLPYYEKWLRDSVDVFGEVYNFMYPNSVTSNLHNYYDASHFYPEIGTMIAHRVLECPDENIPADFGVLVTRENIDQHLEKIREQWGEYILGG